MPSKSSRNPDKAKGGGGKRRRASTIDKLRGLIDSERAVIGVIGMGYVGLPLALEFCRAGFHVLGFDTDKKKVKSLNSGKSYISHIPSKDIKTFGVMATIVANADTSEADVYEIVKAVFENLADFRKTHPAFANLSEMKMISDGLSAPLHPGAVKYYKEKGWIE